MPSSWEKLLIARDLILDQYREVVREIILEKDRPVLKVILNTAITIYIRYNDYGEYTYLAVFSPKPDDMLRFDNFDDLWPVKTRPNHFHTRGMKDVLASKLTGDPGKDIPLFFNAIKTAITKN